jgi:hypothetical protein
LSCRLLFLFTRPVAGHADRRGVLVRVLNVICCFTQTSPESPCMGD